MPSIGGYLIKPEPQEVHPKSNNKEPTSNQLKYKNVSKYNATGIKKKGSSCKIESTSKIQKN